MNPNNRIAAFVAVIAFTFVVPAARAAIAQAVTFDEKVDNSAAIILGKCMRTEAKFDPTGRWIVTYATFNVEQSMKGNAAGQLTVVTPGGSVNGIHQETIGVPVFREGDEHVVFLRNTRLGPSPLYFDQGTYNVVEGERGEKMIVPMPSNVMHIDTQRAMVVAPSDEPKTLDAFRVAVADSMKGSARRVQMSAMGTSGRPQKSLRSVLGENKLLIALAAIGIAIAGWQLRRG